MKWPRINPWLRAEGHRGSESSKENARPRLGLSPRSVESQMLWPTSGTGT